MPALRALALFVVCASALLAPPGAQAEFYRWVDARGQVRISNIPPQGVDVDGRVAPRYNPSSIVAQQKALRTRLQARDAALEAASAAAQSVDEVEADVDTEAAGARSK